MNEITTDITTIIDTLSSIGFVGLLIILAVPKLREKLGFGGSKQSQDSINEDVKNQLDIHTKHLQVANKEMGEVQKSVQSIEKDMATIKNDISWIKKKME